MDLSKLPPVIVSQLTAAVEDYIRSSRKKYLPKAGPLAPELRAAVQPFFPADLLDQTRVLVLQGSRIQDPVFYTTARIMGVGNLPSFSDVAAVTFVDVIVSHEEFTPRLLFHELVHVAQYAQLGSKRFASLYVNGFLRSGCYEEIPLEKNAYELESRLSSSKNGGFFVAGEIKSWIDAAKF